MTSQHQQQLYDGKVFSLLWLADVTSASGGGDDGDSASSRQLLLSTGPDGVVVSNTLTPQGVFCCIFALFRHQRHPSNLNVIEKT